MNELEKYNEQMIEQDIVDFAPPDNMEKVPDDPGDLFGGILRRWYIVMLVLIVVSAIGLTAVWLLVKPTFIITGAIEIAPVLEDPLTGLPDEGGIYNYNGFMYTQAEKLISDPVLERVADELVDEDLKFFTNPSVDIVTKIRQKITGISRKPDPVSILRRAISEKTISVSPSTRSQMMTVMMDSADSEDAKRIVNAFIDAYMATGGRKLSQIEDQQYAFLEEESNVRLSKMKRQRDTINQLSQEYGTDDMDSRYEMNMSRVSSLLYKVSDVNAQRISLEARIRLYEATPEQSIPPQDLLKMRADFINDDIALQQLTQRIIDLDQALIEARQVYAPKHPTLTQKESILKSFQQREQEKRKKLAKDFDNMVAETNNNAGDLELKKMRTELNQLTAIEISLREVLAKEDEQVIDLGKKRLEIDELKFQLEVDKQSYDAVLFRLSQLEMERKRPARINVGYRAQVMMTNDKRVKFSAAIIFCGLVAGVVIAIIRDKADQSLRSPNDVAKRIGIRIIGTTTSPNAVKKALLPQQIIEDYQTIRANLGLFDGEGIPAKLVIASPGMREGKTTFAVNLATSIARSGKKVLLIDGDLRKPDVALLLNLPKGLRGLQDLLFGKNGQQVVYSVPSSGLDVLAADMRNRDDAYELLTLPATPQRIDMISKKYDHIIIDTPPVLAFPDALIWAKMADAVVLTSFAGQTTTGDLRETKEKFAQININVLGTIMTNVPITHSYYRYGYGYYAQQNRRRARSAKAGRKLLLPSETVQQSKEES
jgi:capsular exopolysaccharide synthesis family protein